MIELNPNALYDAPELEQLLGRRSLVRLRSEGGLRAIGDRYLGQQILDAFRHVAETASSQRVPSEKGGRTLEDTQQKKVDQSRRHGESLRVSRSEGYSSLRNQLEESKRVLREAEISR